MYTKEHRKKKFKEFKNFCKLKDTTLKNIFTKVHKNKLFALEIHLSTSKHSFLSALNSL